MAATSYDQHDIILITWKIDVSECLTHIKNTFHHHSSTVLVKNSKFLLIHKLMWGPQSNIFEFNLLVDRCQTFRLQVKRGSHIREISDLHLMLGWVHLKQSSWVQSPRTGIFLLVLIVNLCRYCINNMSSLQLIKN